MIVHRAFWIALLSLPLACAGDDTTTGGSASSGTTASSGGSGASGTSASSSSSGGGSASASGGSTSSGSSSSGGATGSTGAGSAGTTGATTGGAGDGQTDDFERAELGPNWRIVFPPPPNDTQVQIIDDSDLGMGPGPQGFFLANWIGTSFAADQYCEATISADVTDGWIYQIYVRWRESDAARYGFGYNGDPGQDTYEQWIFKYDGVPGPQTRIIASAPAATPPAPGDVLRLEVEGFTLRGYWNGQLVLEATDTDPSRIANGEVGLAARWATGNMGTPSPVKIWEDWSGGSL